jgi:hypothetical protein
MSPLANIRQVAACSLLFFCAAVALGADPAPEPTPPPVQLAPNASAQIAHSAQLTVEAVQSGDALQLTIRRANNRGPIGGDITVTVDGKNQKVTRTGGALEVPLDPFRGDGPRDVDIIVPHDGIREILSAKVSVSDGASAEGLFGGSHKQVAWWILNIVVVLVAALAISRRKT